MSECIRQRPGAVIVAAVMAVSLAATDATTRLGEVRAALGGDRLLTPTTTFVIAGMQRIDTRVTHATAPFEIHCQLPDRFVWKNPSSQGDVFFGFVKDKVITNAPEDLTRLKPVTNEPGRLDTTSERATAVRDDEQLLVAKAYFTVLTMGLFGRSFDGHPVHVAELPGAAAATPAIGLQSADGFAATLVFDAVTHLPDRLLYGVKTPEASYFTEWRYTDFRDVEGRKVPFQLAYATGNDPAHFETHWVYAIDSIRFNVPVDPDVFTLVHHRR